MRRGVSGQTHPIATFLTRERSRNANATVQCPVEPGPYVIVQTVALPKEIPRGASSAQCPCAKRNARVLTDLLPIAKFVVKVNGYTADDEEMLCLNLSVDFMKNPFPRPRKLW